MNDLNIPGSASTPTITTSWQLGQVHMAGDSYPENSFEFFGEVIGWIDNFLKNSTTSLQLKLNLVYLNTSSVKAMMDIFDLLEAAHGQGRQVSVVWHYDTRNERVVDLADEFREDCSFPFDITADER